MPGLSQFHALAMILYTTDMAGLSSGQKLYIITSPTCQKEGQQIYIQKGDAAFLKGILVSADDHGVFILPEVEDTFRFPTLLQ